MKIIFDLRKETSKHTILSQKWKKVEASRDDIDQMNLNLYITEVTHRKEGKP